MQVEKADATLAALGDDAAAERHGLCSRSRTSELARGCEMQRRGVRTAESLAGLGHGRIVVLLAEVPHLHPRRAERGRELVRHRLDALLRELRRFLQAILAVPAHGVPAAARQPKRPRSAGAQRAGGAGRTSAGRGPRRPPSSWRRPSPTSPAHTSVCEWSTLNGPTAAGERSGERCGLGAGSSASPRPSSPRRPPSSSCSAASSARSP